MAIPCLQCGLPVHEQVVICPHCGDPSGVAADPIAEAEIEIIKIREPADERVTTALTFILQPLPAPVAPEAELPRAIARRKR